MADERIQAALVAMQGMYLAVQQMTASDWQQLDLTVAQIKALFSLRGDKEVTISDLAREMRIALPNASTVVDRLVKHGLVERHEDQQDRRRTLVRLGDRGDELTGRLLRGRRARLVSSLGKLDSRELEALTVGLRALARVFVQDRTGADSSGDANVDSSKAQEAR